MVFALVVAHRQRAGIPAHRQTVSLRDGHKATEERPLAQIILRRIVRGQFGKRRMHQRTVIALGVILEDQLPIGPHLILNAPGGTQLRQIPTREFRLQWGKHRLQRWGMPGEVYEDEPLP